MFRSSTATPKTKGTSISVPALVLSAVVLIIAMAGSATAAQLITGKNIKDGTVTSADLQDQGVKSRDLKNNGVRTADVKDGTLGAADLDPAVNGKLNAPSLSGYEVVTDSVLFGSGSQNTVYLACSAGNVVLTAGYSWEDTSVTTKIFGSSPAKVIRGDSLLWAPAEADFADGWVIEGENGGLDPQHLTGYIICVDPS
jgi:hypothetical protein